MAIKKLLFVGSALALTACGASSPAAVPETHEAVASHPVASAVEATASNAVDPLAVCEGVEPDAAPVTLTIETISFAFDTQRLEGPQACQPFLIEFTNHDTAAPGGDPGRHDINIRVGNVLGPLVFDGDLVGQQTIRYEVPGLPAGEHYFYCSVARHEMSGTLVVVDR